MNTLFKFLLVVTIGLFGSACSMSTVNHLIPSQAKYFHLKKDITLPAGQTRAFFQNGKRVTQQEFDRYQQHCRLELSELSEHPQTVYAQTLTITSATWDEEMIAALPNETHLAVNHRNQIPTETIELALADNNRAETMDLVHFWFDAKTAPSLYRLTCAGRLSDGNLNDAPYSFPPNISQINQILGPYGDIE